MRTYNQRTTSSVKHGLDAAEVRKMLETVGIDVPADDVEFSIRIDASLEGGKDAAAAGQIGTVSMRRPAKVPGVSHGAQAYVWPEDLAAVIGDEELRSLPAEVQCRIRDARAPRSGTIMPDQDVITIRRDGNRMVVVRDGRETELLVCPEDRSNVAANLNLFWGPGSANPKAQ